MGSGCDDRPHGLQFSKKLYFEGSAAAAAGTGFPCNAAAAAAAVSGSGVGAGSSRTAVGAGQGRKGKGGAAAQQPPRCQVEGCAVDLSDAKTYYSRHKVCGAHSKAPRVVVAGLEQRFCQQCSRFHQLPEFDQGKRSCRRRLAGHNERRRKPPPAPYASLGRFAASLHEPGRFRSYLLDFSYPRVPNSVRDTVPLVRAGDRHAPNIPWHHAFDNTHPNSGSLKFNSHSYMQSSVPGAEVAALPAAGLRMPCGNSGVKCALSLLSTQPWDAVPVAGQNQEMPMLNMTGGYSDNVRPTLSSESIYFWSTSSYEGQDIQHSSQLPHEMRLDDAAGMSSNIGQFSGELELALHGNRSLANHGAGSSSPFNDSSNVMHWSL